MVQPAGAPRGKRRARGDAKRRASAVARRPSRAQPAKLWGGRFSAATNALVEEYTNSVDVDAFLVPYDIAGSIAHARMLGRQKIIAKSDADAIVRGLQQIYEEFQRGEFVLRRELEDVHTNVEARLAEKIGAAAGRLHTARSRNDQVATDVRMYVMDAADDAQSHLLAFVSALLDLAEAHRVVIMPGYTHMQRAQPVLFAHHLLAYVEMFLRDATRFAVARAMADALPLGSGALAGVSYPIDRESVARELGFTSVSANSIDAVSDRDFIVDYMGAAALCMVHVSRLAEELVLWSTAEFGFIRLPDAFATGSSIMPQKKNPDVAELARGRAGRVAGNLLSELMMLKGLPLAYNRDLQEDKPPLFSSHVLLLTTLSVLTAMLPAIEVDGERAGVAAAAGHSLATDLADYLVRKGLPFREAHEAVGGVVRLAEKRGCEIAALALADLRRSSPLFGEDALRIDVRASLRARDVPGGTAPRRVASALKRARRDVATIAAQLEKLGGG